MMGLACFPKVMKVAAGECSCSAVTVKKHPNDRLERCVLAEPFEVGDYQLEKGTTVFFNPEGKLITAEITVNMMIHDTQIPLGSKLIFKNGVLFKLRFSEPTVYRGIEIKEGIDLILYPSGNIKEFTPENPVKVGNLELAAGRITFFENGELDQFTLAGPSSVDGYSLSEREAVELHPSGNLKRGLLTTNTTIDGYPIEAGEVHFYDNGKLKQGNLAQPSEIQTIPCAEGAITFYDTGNVMQATLEVDFVLQDHPFPAGTLIHLSPEGKLEAVNLKKDTVLQEVECRAGMVYFYPSGKLKACYMDEPLEFWEYYRCSEGYVMFYESGNLKGCTLADKAADPDGDSILRGSIIELDEEGSVTSHYFEGMPQPVPYYVNQYLFDGTLNDTPSTSTEESN